MWGAFWVYFRDIDFRIGFTRVHKPREEHFHHISLQRFDKT
jgi:hypothetical protein